MSNRESLEDVGQAVAFVQQSWPRFRVAAAKAFMAHGRGAFLIDLTNYQGIFSCTPAEVTYLDVSCADGASESMSRFLLCSELEEYDPNRQIVFVFWHPVSEVASIRVLAETPDGKPRTAPERRWFSTTRSCPECGEEFFSDGPWGQCPKCQNEFVADYSNQKTEMVHIPPIVEFG